MAFLTSERDLQSPFIRVKRPLPASSSAMFSLEPELKLSRATTSFPLETRKSQTELPMKPAPPVTRNLMSDPPLVRRHLVSRAYVSMIMPREPKAKGLPSSAAPQFKSGCPWRKPAYVLEEGG